MASVQKRKRKRRAYGQEYISKEANTAHHIGPGSIPNLSLVCPFCDEDSKVRSVYATYNNLLEDVDMDRVIITPRKIFYPRECIMGHTFWSVEEVPWNYEKMLKEIEEIKEFTRKEMEEYKDSLKESQIGYEMTRSAKNKLKRKKERAEKKKREREEARIRREEEKERIRQAKLDGTYVREEWPSINVIKYPGRKGYEVVPDENSPEEIERRRKRDEFLATPGILQDRGSINRYEGYRRVDAMLEARGLKRKCFREEEGE